MKRIILSAIAVITFGFVNAQDIKYGVKGGLNFAVLSGDVDDASGKIGVHAGGFAEFKISDKFFIQPELLFSTQGAKENGLLEQEGDFYAVEMNYKLAYINVPVMAKYYVTKKFNLEAGPQIGFLVNAKAKATILGISQENDVTSDFKTINIGVNFGAGYDISENIFVGARYNFGLLNLISGEAANDFKVYNTVFSFAVGYKF